MQRFSAIAVLATVVLMCGGEAGLAAEDQWRIPFTIPTMPHPRPLCEATVSYQALPDSEASPEGTELLLTTSGAFSPLSRFELGGTIGYASRDYEILGSATPRG